MLTVAISLVVAVAVVGGWALGGGWKLLDMDVYWNAALAWRETGNPYAMGPGVTDHTVYRYAPWFAAAWIPITLLPRDVADVAWSTILVAASLGCVAPLARGRGAARLALAMLMGGLLIGISASGNVQPLLVAGLAWGIDRRSGPIWVGLAGSLKVVPILFVLVYLGRREWGRAGLSVLIAAVLWLPLFAFDRPAVLTSFDYGGASGSLATLSPVLWAGAAIVAIGAALWLAIRRSRYASLAAGTAAILALPRLFLYDVTLLVPAAVRRTSQ